MGAVGAHGRARHTPVVIAVHFVEATVGQPRLGCMWAAWVRCGCSLGPVALSSWWTEGGTLGAKARWGRMAGPLVPPVPGGRIEASFRGHRESPSLEFEEPLSTCLQMSWRAVGGQPALLRGGPVRGARVQEGSRQAPAGVAANLAPGCLLLHVRGVRDEV